MIHAPSPSKQAGSISPREKTGAGGAKQHPAWLFCSHACLCPRVSTLMLPKLLWATWELRQWHGGRVAKAEPGERREWPMGPLLLVSFQQGLNMDAVSPNSMTLTFILGQARGAGQGGEETLGALAVRDPKHQQAQGQHAGYPIPCMTASACSYWLCLAAVVVSVRWDVTDIEPWHCWLKCFKIKPWEIRLQGKGFVSLCHVSRAGIQAFLYR